MAIIERPGGSGGESPQPESRAKKAAGTKPYFVNFWVDAAFMGGISVVTYLIIVLLMNQTGYESSRTRTVINWGVWLSWVVNWPHFAATSYRLYRSRETMNQYPVTAYIVPLLLIPAFFAGLFLPETFAPWYVKVFYVWSPYHFSGQTLGLATLYARRTGFVVSPLMKWSLTWFIFSTYIELQAKSEGPGTKVSFWGINDIPSIGIPSFVETWAHYGTIIMGLLLVYATIEAIGTNGKGVPMIMFVPVVAQVVWFKLAYYGDRPNSFLEFVPLFHSTQYLFIAWFMQMKERQVDNDEVGSPRRVGIETLLWGVGIGLGGMWLFDWGPEATRWFFADLTGWIGDLDIFVATAVFITTVQIHHFFVDGVIWKLRNPKVRGALNTSVDELFGRS